MEVEDLFALVVEEDLDTQDPAEEDSVVLVVFPEAHLVPQVVVDQAAAEELACGGGEVACAFT